MPAPLNPNLWPAVLHDQDANPISGTNPLPVTVIAGGSTPNRPTFVTNQQNVASPGTAVALQAQAIPNGFTVFIRARPTNTGNIYIGNSASDAENHATALILEPGAFVTYGITDVSLVFIDADNAADGVMWTVET